MNKLSRQEIETVCLLHAVGTGCGPAELALRLGLNATLGSAVASALEVLAQDGLLAAIDGRYSPTGAGREFLRARRGEDRSSP